VILWIFRRAKKGEDQDRPQIVGTNARSKAVLDRAKQLAKEGRGDAQAVSELRAVAGGRRRSLRQAEQASRFNGYHHELAQANLTNRLLKAALAREAVPLPSQEDAERIAALEALSTMSQSDQWAHLTRLQPALVEVDRDVRAGRFGDLGSRDDELVRGPTHEIPVGERRRAVNLSSSDPRPTDEQMGRIRRRGEALDKLRNRLLPLVGPASEQDDVLLACQRAQDIATAYLLRSNGDCARSASPHP
jgi:hypothetical protein